MDSQVFCLVLLPYTLASLEDEGLKTYERYRRKNIGNQIGLCPTASVEHSATERSQAAARMALGQTCGIEVSDLLREEKVQREQRQQLDAEELALQVSDADGGKVAILLLPEDAVATKIQWEEKQAGYDPPGAACPMAALISAPASRGDHPNLSKTYVPEG